MSPTDDKLKFCLVQWDPGTSTWRILGSGGRKKAPGLKPCLVGAVYVARKRATHKAFPQRLKPLGIEFLLGTAEAVP
jgi:hypothetical protein